MSTTCEPEELVRILNDLFARFDKLASVSKNFYLGILALTLLQIPVQVYRGFGGVGVVKGFGLTGYANYMEAEIVETTLVVSRFHFLGSDLVYPSCV